MSRRKPSRPITAAPNDIDDRALQLDLVAFWWAPLLGFLSSEFEGIRSCSGPG
ncbi:hypothetical protein AKJ09_03805 [Labilithrix luteola]|uniref:Uncharacterized protein n=1 Tax=Labilithrix luteola TaxID=1391654 RepID=A0A0K1PUT6_9BACT|nr:hypothetical protein AKJ09_03805 [Labilithrix luteola]